MLAQPLFAFASVCYSLNVVLKTHCHTPVAVCMTLESASDLLRVSKLVPLLPKSCSSLSATLLMFFPVKFVLVFAGCLSNLGFLPSVLSAIIAVVESAISIC